jgi:prepilin-type N-terminal cleavage/methylation domain-containing protein
MSHRAGKPGGRRGGFTLVELLLVMFIMAVLVTLVVGVGAYIIEEGKKQKTLERQRLLMAAVEAYFTVMNYYPPDREDPCSSNYDPNKSMKVLLAALDGVNCDEFAEAVREKTKPFLDEITDPNTDGFGKPMRYYARRGIAGKPFFISSGPDENFGDLDEKKREDNIRSDTGE